MGRTLLGAYGPPRGVAVAQETIESLVLRAVALVQDAPNALDGAIESSRLSTLLRQATSRNAELRRAYFRLLIEQGYELQDIGEAVDPPITKERVRQILDA